jgi:ribosomal protein L6P/L9E
MKKYIKNGMRRIVECKGKGIKFTNEQLRRKAGKSASKK